MGYVKDRGYMLWTGSMSAIFVVTAVGLNGSGSGLNADERRTLTWHASLATAIEAMNKNVDHWSDEGWYTHFVIEEYEEGTRMRTSAHWFEIAHWSETHEEGDGPPSNSSPEFATIESANPRPAVAAWALS